MDSWDIKSNNIFDRRHLNIVKKWWIDVDKINFLLVIGIIIFGLMMTATSSPAIAKKINVDKFFFLKKQLIFAFIGVTLLIAISFLDQEKIKIFALLGLVATIFLLVAVLLFGSEAKGAKRWIAIAGFTLQPSEFAKTFFVVLNAFILQRLHFEKWEMKYGISAALYLLIVCLLILQPDFGMTLTLTVLWVAQLFAYGLPLPFITAIGVLGVFGGIGAYLVFPHVEDRINKFLDSGEKNYQAERSIDAFVNGSFFGTGPGNGVVKKFIPDAHTDFIFAVVGEEYGIISCIILIVIKLLPTKGMTLPFISYGGSSMISMAICFGLILAFTKRKYHRDVDYGNLKSI
jgi:cell division protein FtsW